MVHKLENFKYNIEDAFGHCFYLVPDYQREYVWKEKEVTTLLQDIADEFQAGSGYEYFIGTILVAPKDNKQIEVIDGQQRLTTLFLILCALKALLKDNIFDDLILKKSTNKDGSIETHFRLNPRYEGAEEIIRVITNCYSYEQIRSKLADAGIRLYGTQNNLVNAYESIILFFRQYFSNKDQEINTESLRSFWGYLANSVVFIQIKTDVNSALKIFETINERGVGLNPMDLLKNLLFTRVEPSDFNRLKNEWKKITKSLEKHKEKPLRFLRYFLMANYPIKGIGEKKEPIIREDQIYEWLTIKENVKLCGYEKDPFPFVRKLQDGVECYLNFLEGKDLHGSDSIYLDNLRKLCGGAFSLHYIVLLAASRLPSDLFNHLVCQIEIFLFYFIVTKSTTRDLERDFSIWADEIRSIADIEKSHEQKKQLEQFIEKRISHGIEKKQSDFEHYFLGYDLFTLQQYRTRYILAKLTQYADMAYMGTTAGKLDNYMKLEIEHILPNTPKDELRKAFEEDNLDVKYDDIKNRLGNLTLLEKPINIVAGRKFFQEKKKEYNVCGNYLTRSIANKPEVGKNSSITRINKKLLSFENWNKDEIEQRQEMLMTLAREIWVIRDLKE